jgi:hypothetical protein
MQFLIDPLSTTMFLTMFHGCLTSYSQALLPDRNVAILSAHDALLAAVRLKFSWLSLVRDARLQTRIV